MHSHHNFYALFTKDIIKFWSKISVSVGIFLLKIIFLNSDYFAHFSAHFMVLTLLVTFLETSFIQFMVQLSNFLYFLNICLTITVPVVVPVYFAAFASSNQIWTHRNSETLKLDKLQHDRRRSSNHHMWCVKIHVFRARSSTPKNENKTAGNNNFPAHR